MPAYRLSSVLSIAILVSVPLARAQTMDDRIMSEHVRLRIPLERVWLGNDSILDIERIWRFMNAATGDNLPRRIPVVIDWNGRVTMTNFEEGTITVGIGRAAAAADTKGFLLHNTALAMARLGLYGLSRGGTLREDCQFLSEGMAEILVHEYERSSRSLGGAWIISQLLDKMGLLGLSVQSAWTGFSGGSHNLRAASPGITFLITCRELHGRDRVLKLFESLRKSNLQDSFTAAFKTGPASLEDEWLKRVRSYREAEDITVTSEEDAPRITDVVAVPGAVKDGAPLELRLFAKDAMNDLLPTGVFLQDEASGKVLQAQAARQNGAPYMEVTLPIEAGRKPGKYNYRITAVDESGNVRRWNGNYTVAP